MKNDELLELERMLEKHEKSLDKDDHSDDAAELFLEDYDEIKERINNLEELRDAGDFENFSSNEKRLDKIIDVFGKLKNEYVGSEYDEDMLMDIMYPNEDDPDEKEFDWPSSQD